MSSHATVRFARSANRRATASSTVMLSAAVMVVFGATSAAMAVGVSTISFQEGVDGYSGTVERLISTATTAELPSASNPNPQNWFVDGGGTAASPDQQLFTRFDNIIGSGAGRIPANATVLDARLIYTTGPATVSNAQTGGFYYVAGLTSAFTPSSTYINYGALGPYYGNAQTATRSTGGFYDNAENATDTDSTIDPDQVVSAPVGSLVRQWVANPSLNHGFTVQAGRPQSTTDGWAVGTAWNTDPTRRPKLSVTYTTDPIDTFTFQEGVNGYAGTTMAWLRQDNNNNNGNPVALDGSQLTQQFLDGPATNSPDDQALVKFSNIFANAGGTIPSAAEIVKAELVITTGASSDNAQSRGGYDLHQVLRDWDLDTSDGSKPSLYTEWSGGAGPSIEGGDIAAAVDRANAMARDGEASFDVTSILKAWQSGASNFGFNIQAGNTADGWQIFFNGATDPTVRPKLVVYTVGAGDSIWASTAGGDWITGSNWQGGNVPNAAGRTAVFGSAIIADSTVVLEADKAVGNVRFDNAARYTLAGPGTLTLERVGAASAVQVLTGNHTIATNVSLKNAVEFDVASSTSLTLAGNLTQASGVAASVTKLGAGTLNFKNVRAASLAVNGGSVIVTAANVNDSTSVVGQLAIATGSKLDLQDNALVVDYASGASSPLSAVQLAIREGRLVGSVASSAYTLGYAEGSSLTGVTSFAGVTVDDSMVLVDLTLKGDFNLDKAVNFDDLLKLAANYNNTTGSATWAQGDSNHDGSVNFDDLLQLAANYNQSAAGSIGGEWALAQTSVPEPTSLVTTALAAGAALRRRRRR